MGVVVKAIIVVGFGTGRSGGQVSSDGVTVVVEIMALVVVLMMEWWL